MSPLYSTCYLRYAFTPLLDRDEDYSSDDEDDILYSDAWDGLKMRGKKDYRPDTPDGETHSNTEHILQRWNKLSGADPELDPLKWVEENIPDMDGALPIIDSEEEIETTKEEISKLHWNHIYCFHRIDHRRLWSHVPWNMEHNFYQVCHSILDSVEM